MPYYAKCDVISGEKKIQTEISHQQNIAALKWKRTCITVLNILSMISYNTNFCVIDALKLRTSIRCLQNEKEVADSYNSQTWNALIGIEIHIII